MIRPWSDRMRGLAEIARVARHRLVIVTYAPTATGFWLVEDYFPAIGEIDRRICPSLEEFRCAVGPVDVRPLPIPHDCTDGFLAALLALILCLSRPRSPPGHLYICQDPAY